MRDNIIEWIFEKAFDRLTLEGQDLFTYPFHHLYQQTFKSYEIASFITQLTKKNISIVKTYLEQQAFVERFIYSKLKTPKNHLDLFTIIHSVYDSTEKFQTLLDKGHQPTIQTINLSLLNHHEHFFTLLLPLLKEPLTREQLIYCTDNDSLYFTLRKHNFFPNISVLEKAIFQTTPAIIKDISANIHIDKISMEKIFQANQTDIIKFCVEDVDKVDPNMVSYAIINGNIELVKWMESKNLFKWHNDLYYSAVLSGSSQMIFLVENRLPEIHANHQLDLSTQKRGYKTLITDETIYRNGGRLFFAHTMNYAVQSDNLDIVKYIRSKGYGIATSNLISSMRIGNVEILKYLLEELSIERNVDRIHLPFHLIHYIGIYFNTLNKTQMAQLLWEKTNLFNHNYNDLSVNDYRIETLHLSFIHQKQTFTEKMAMDPDYLSNIIEFFNDNSKERVINMAASLIRLEQSEALISFFQKIKPMDRHTIMNLALLLTSNINLLSRLLDLIETEYIPSTKVICEIICYYRLSTIIFLHKRGMIPDILNNSILCLAVALGDDTLIKVLEKLFDKKISIDKRFFDQIIISGNDIWIESLIDNNLTDKEISVLVENGYKELLYKKNIKIN